MIELQETADGVILLLHAQPRARRNAIVGIHGGRLKVAVVEAPEDGKANGAILDVLAAALGVRRAQLHIVAGTTHSRKKCLVRQVPIEELRRRIAECLPNRPRA